MTNLKLDLEIINKVKTEISGKRKAIMFSILSSLWLFLIYSDPADDNSIYVELGIWQGIPLILFFLLLISTGYVLRYVFFVVSSKGKLILTTDFILVEKDKEKTVIKLNDINSIIFHETKTALEEIVVTVELKTEKINIEEEINIPFANERQILRKLVDEWNNHGVNVEIKII